jgi:uncharacterized protein YbjT (DUF2867 family)
VRILLSGATGFVGRHLLPALEAAGHEIRSGTRNPDAARRRHPDETWVRLDVEDEASIDAALTGCDAAFYLVHGMGEGSEYPEREARSARQFLAAAEAHGLKRIVYLGGVLPKGGVASRHLASRGRTGELLRSGTVSAIELRAAMIVGEGSVSWTMVRDLAARLPAMVLPRWLRNKSWPVALDDVVWGLLAALGYPGDDSRVFELPGPERIAHRDVLARVAKLLGHRRPMLSVPVLSPRLSSYWIGLVTRVELSLARELVEGLRYDLDPTDEVLWERAFHQPLTLEEAARLALASEAVEATPSPKTIARMRAIGERVRAQPPWSTERGPCE